MNAALHTPFSRRSSPVSGGPVAPPAPPPAGGAFFRPGKTPWSLILSGDGRAAINDADGHTLFITGMPEMATWVVDLVNEEAAKP